MNPRVVLLTLCAVALVNAKTRYIKDYASYSDHEGGYVLDSGIVVRPRDTLYIGSGTRIMVKGLHGITVKGGLFAIGEKDRPIRLMSSSQRTRYDWNGIYGRGGKIEMEYVILSNAAEGMTLDSTTECAVRACVFRNNGQWHIRYKGTIADVKTDTFFSYSTHKRMPQETHTQVFNDRPGKMQMARRAHMYASGGHAVLSASMIGAAMVFQKRYHDRKSDYEKLSGEPGEHESVRLDYKQAQYTRDFLYAGAVAAGINALAFLPVVAKNERTRRTVMWIRRAVMASGALYATVQMIRYAGQAQKHYATYTAYTGTNVHAHTAHWSAYTDAHSATHIYIAVTTINMAGIGLSFTF
jgi:hypothetical protein